MEFVEAPEFTKYLSEYLKDDEFKELQRMLQLHPEAGDVIQGSGGLRKVRWLDPRRGKGKRGGLRIIYFYFPGDEQIWFMTIYGKNEAGDLTSEQKKILKFAVEREKRDRSLRRQ